MPRTKSRPADEPAGREVSATRRPCGRVAKLILKATGAKGVPQGGVISPLLSNLYLNEVDLMLEKAQALPAACSVRAADHHHSDTSCLPVSPDAPRAS